MSKQKYRRTYGLEQVIACHEKQIKYIEDEITELQEDLIWEKHRLLQADVELKRKIE